ncbi:MAG: adenosylmethionine--8-amino-7-oxononanoate transaminase [Parachlamydiaceae bacterium]|nr:adenosylmethionine--8-amino-7-oxononanoate transaminase [Parachlamydiaceae bacterium]
MAFALIENDQRCIWHPFTQVQTAFPPIPIVRAKGIYLYSQDGREIIDGISSWWVNLHGHCHPYISESILDQSCTLEHVIFADFTHAPAIELGSRLLTILPGKMEKIFYTDNGSTAVEAALKMAFQYWHNHNPKTKKSRVVCFKHSYHGDTFGAMSAAGKNEYNQPFWKLLFEVDKIDPPLEGVEERSLVQLEEILIKGETACFIFEPLVLAAGGMIIYPAKGLDALMALCHKYGVLTIADEVMTGFGRTGTLFACDQLNEDPDIICLSKGLTGGFLPLGATACKQEIFAAFLGDTLQRAFLHGHSYTGNPIACRSALASLELLQNDDCTKSREMIARCHKRFCNNWKSHPKLLRCEYLGTLLALEYRSNHAHSYFVSMREKLYRFFIDRNILLRPLGNVLYVLPPYCINENELLSIYDMIILTLEGEL